MIKTVDKTLDILEAIERLGGEARVSDIARDVGEKVSTTSNIVRTLARRRYLEQAAGRRAYRLGRGLLSLVDGGLVEGDLADRLAPAAGALAREVGENVIVSRFAEGTLRRIVRVDSGHALSVNPDGEGHPVYEYADGRLLLSFAGGEELEDAYRRMGTPGAYWNGIASLAGLRNKLSRIREAGFAVVKNKAGVTSLAAALEMKRPAMRPALSIVLPTRRCGKRRERKLLERLIVHARLIPILRGRGG